MTPTISVVMSSYNTARYLPSAIESILGQSFQDFELILIDDASTDDTAQLLQAYHDPRMIVLRNEQNLGLTHSLNRGVAAARGRFIARMDADDLAIPPTRFAEQVQFLQAHPSVGVLAGDSSSIDADGRPLRDGRPHYQAPASHQMLCWLLLWGNPIPHMTVMLRRDLLAAQGYDPAYNTAEDYDLWTRLAQHTQLHRSAAVWAQRRLLGSSVSHSRLPEQLVLARQIMARELARLRSVSDVSPDVLQTLFETCYHEVIPQPSSNAFREAAALLLDAYQHFMLRALTQEERAFITADAIKLMRRLAQRAYPQQPWQARQILWQIRALATREFFSRITLRQLMGRKI